MTGQSPGESPRGFLVSEKQLSLLQEEKMIGYFLCVMAIAALVFRNFQLAAELQKERRAHRNAMDSLNDILRQKAERRPARKPKKETEDPDSPSQVLLSRRGKHIGEGVIDWGEA